MNRADLNQLLADCPSLESAWQAHERSDEYQPDLPYVEAGAIAHIVVDNREEREELDRFFERLDALLVGADVQAADLIATGLLEVIQNRSLMSGVSLAEWSRFSVRVQSSYGAD